MALDPHDLGMFRANGELLNYLVLWDGPKGPCMHLTLYLSFANGVVVGAKSVDDRRSAILGNNSVTPFVDIRQYKENAIAEMIKIGDEDLPGLVKPLKAAGLDDDTISHLYARLFLGHEKEQKYDLILDDLTRAGLPIPAGNCRRT